MIDRSDVMEKVRRSLGRSVTPTDVPPPPVLPEEIVRQVHGGADLSERFAKQAAELKMVVTSVTTGEIVDQIVRFVLSNPIRKVAMSDSPIFQRIAVRDALISAGITVKAWSEMTLDELYDFDCAITDVDYAVAESGTIVIRPDKQHGRGLTLVPMFHIAVIEPNQFLPDLVDLFAKLSDQAYRSNVILISGPSKTADIEMNVVTGVHGPNVVAAFILR